MVPASTLTYNDTQRQRFMSQSNETDLFSVWARRIRSSDASAFEAFFRALHGPLERYAESIVSDAALASDMVQDAFVRIWEGRERLDPSQSIKAFAYRTVRNLCLNRIRDRKNREHLLSQRYEPGGSPGFGPEDSLDAERLSGLLRQWIEELPERQREALQLSRFQGMSHEEVAEAMDVSPRTVNNHLVKALRTIRERIRAYEPSLLDL